MTLSIISKNLSASLPLNVGVNSIGLAIIIQIFVKHPSLPSAGELTPTEECSAAKVGKTVAGNKRYGQIYLDLREGFSLFLTFFFFLTKIDPRSGRG